jgi:hypothetical protein
VSSSCEKEGILFTIICATQYTCSSSSGGGGGNSGISIDFNLSQLTMIDLN